LLHLIQHKQRKTQISFTSFTTNPSRYQLLESCQLEQNLPNMQIFNTFFSLAAFAACLTPVFSAPVAEPDTTSLVVKRGVLSDTAQSCYNDVKTKCDEIIVKIDADVEIDVDLAAQIVVDLQVVVDLIVKLGVDLKAKIQLGGLTVADVRACVSIIIKIVELCASILLKIKAHLSASVSVSIFAAVVLQLYACIKIVIDLCISVCLGSIGGLSVLDLVLVADLVVKLTACLTVFVNACLSLGISI
jgi:hypothetical protein